MNLHLSSTYWRLVLGSLSKNLIMKDDRNKRRKYYYFRLFMTYVYKNEAHLAYQ